MQLVTSARNPVVKQVRKAVARGGLTDDGLCIAEGFHLLEEARRSGCEIVTILAAESTRCGVQHTTIPDDLFRSIATTENSQGVIALVRPPAWSIDDLFRGEALVVVLDGIQDPGNAGTIIRSAEAFGATGAALLKGSVNPYNPKCIRASAGSIFRVPLLTPFDEELLYERRIEMYALVPGAEQDIARCPLDHPAALIIGSEARGVRESLRAKSIPASIPTTGVESLNAATAAAIALYEARRQRTANP